MVVDVYTRGIVERLNNESLQDENNPFTIVLDGCLGEYLTNRDNHFLDTFLITATDKYLDIHADIFGLKRRENETDESFRQRIITDETLIQRTTDFEKLDCQLWVYKDGVDKKNVLTSRNPYLKKFHDDDYVFISSGTDVEYLQKKFILGDILWLL